MRHKLELGTAQFGSAYGMTNTLGQIAPDAAVEIITEALRLGIRTFDTALAYGNADGLLRQVIGDRPNVCITTKIACGETAPLCDTLLIHDPQNLTRGCGRIMEYAKREGIAKRIGISAYDRQQIERALDLVHLDVVQVPVSVVDQRLIHDGTLEYLRGLGIEVHARSVFLQGVLLADLDFLPAHLRPWHGALKKVMQAALFCPGGRIAFCLQFVLQQHVDRVVVGVTSIEELQQVAKAADSRWRAPTAPYLAVPDQELLNPTTWPKEVA